MKKFLTAFVLAFITAGIVSQAAFAAAELPKASVWFEPASAAVGETVTLNALVYNNQSSDATVTVAFKTPTATIGTASALVTKATAKTISVTWTMPETTTVVTATVTSAVDAAKKSLPGLLGVLGTATVGSTVTPTVTPISFPGGKQINAWFAPILSKVEAFRTEQYDHFVALKVSTQKKLDVAKNPAPDDKNVASQALGNPLDYFVLIYATGAAAIFVSQALFYSLTVLIFLLLLRFIVNLIF